MRVVSAAAVLVLTTSAVPAFAADPLLERAEDEYQRGQFAKARDGILSLFDYDALHGADVPEARAYLAASYLALKDRVSARNQLVLLARASPEYRLDPLTFVPELLAIADEARAIVEREGQARATDGAAPSQRSENNPAGTASANVRVTDGSSSAQGAGKNAASGSSAGSVGASTPQGAERGGPIASGDGSAGLSAASDRDALTGGANDRHATVGASTRVEIGATTTPGASSGEPRLRITPVIGGVLDAAGRSIGPSAAAWIGYGEVELGPRLVIGPTIGIGGELAYLPWPGRVTPRFAGRLTAFPDAGAFGGGPVMGLRLPLAGGLSATAEVGAEFFRAPDSFRSFALTLGVGIGFDVVGGEGA